MKEEEKKIKVENKRRKNNEKKIVHRINKELDHRYFLHAPKRDSE